MRYVVTPTEIRALDIDTINTYGLPSLVLMENAARAVAQAVLALEGEQVCIFCGTGNNGGDGYAVARWLKKLGKTVCVFSLDGTLTEEARINQEILTKWKVEIIPFLDQQNVIKKAQTANIVIDAIFGTGLNREVTGQAKQAIEQINTLREKAKIVAIDIPSGVHAHTGQIMGSAVKADVTVALAYAKYGHLLFPGRDYTGILQVAEICTVERLFNARQLDKSDLQTVFAARKSNTHKGDYGKIAVIGGSVGMEGAVQLCGMAALRTGAGMVTLGVPEEAFIGQAARMSELMAKPIRFRGNGYQDIDVLCDGKDCIVYGPGLGKQDRALDILKYILDTYDVPIVVDADGLNALSADLTICNKKQKVVLTPHYGEMSRLLRQDIADISADPVGCAQTLARKTGAIVLLKGATTIIASPDGLLTFNTMGSPGMATAGSGDVLSGILAAILCMGQSTYDSAAFGAYLHGAAGSAAAERIGERYMMASDIIESLCKV